MSEQVPDLRKPLKSPVLFLVFNRPESTRQVFEAIRKARPAKLFVAADGPREIQEGEDERCREVREIVDKGVDWDCRVYRLYREENLGCKVAVSRAIDWFFEHVNEGIILEDDCLPDQSFFTFCQELLTYYRYDPRVSSISGSNPFNDGIDIRESYFFSKYNRIWGWATWKRAWLHYDVNITFWPELKKRKGHYVFFQSRRERKFYESIWDKCYNNRIDTWDFQWYLCKLMQLSYTAVSAKNIVSNIGFGRDSTHTAVRNLLANYKLESLTFPLNHQKHVFVDYRKDAFTQRFRFNRSLLRLILHRLRLL